jgi:hypothetical protein
VDDLVKFNQGQQLQLNLVYPSFNFGLRTNKTGRHNPLKTAKSKKADFGSINDAFRLLYAESQRNVA